MKRRRPIAQDSVSKARIEEIRALRAALEALSGECAAQKETIAHLTSSRDRERTATQVLAGILLLAFDSPRYWEAVRSGAEALGYERDQVRVEIEMASAIVSPRVTMAALKCVLEREQSEKVEE